MREFGCHFQNWDRIQDRISYSTFNSDRPLIIIRDGIVIQLLTVSGLLIIIRDRIVIRLPLIIWLLIVI